MSARETFFWSSRTRAGVVLYAAALIAMPLAAPSEAAISCVIGGGMSLALFGITGSRFPRAVLILLTLVVSVCAAFALVTARHYALIPTAVLQIVALFLMQGRERSPWSDEDIIPTPRTATMERFRSRNVLPYANRNGLTP